MIFIISHRIEQPCLRNFLSFQFIDTMLLAIRISKHEVMPMLFCFCDLWRLPKVAEVTWFHAELPEVVEITALHLEASECKRSTRTLTPNRDPKNSWSNRTHCSSFSKQRWSYTFSCPICVSSSYILPVKHHYQSIPLCKSNLVPHHKWSALCQLTAVGHQRYQVGHLHVKGKC